MSSQHLNQGSSTVAKKEASLWCQATGREQGATPGERQVTALHDLCPAHSPPGKVQVRPPGLSGKALGTIVCPSLSHSSEFLLTSKTPPSCPLLFGVKVTSSHLYF